MKSIPNGGSHIILGKLHLTPDSRRDVDKDREDGKAIKR